MVALRETIFIQTTIPNLIEINLVVTEMEHVYALTRHLHYEFIFCSLFRAHTNGNIVLEHFIAPSVLFLYNYY